MIIYKRKIMKKLLFKKTNKNKKLNNELKNTNPANKSPDGAV
jgi:hypothetical protein